MQNRPRAVYGPVILRAAWQNVRQSFSFVKAALPSSVHLMTLKTDLASGWGTAVFRLQNIFESDYGHAEDVRSACFWESTVFDKRVLCANR